MNDLRFFWVASQDEGTQVGGGKGGGNTRQISVFTSLIIMQHQLGTELAQRS